MKPILYASLAFLLLSLCGCSPNSAIRSVEREDLFSLEIGILEDQIALFNLEGSMGMHRASIAMRDGLFYISDGSGGKILRYNSYGDLLFMVYNEETNPSPLTLRPLVEGSLVTRWSISYPLLEPGEIAVDSRKHIYVRDRLPYEQHRFDTENMARLSNIVLHFDADGRFLYSLGREGIGGSPFPIIESIYTTINDELAVITRLPGGWDIYWYNNEGAFLFVVRLRADALPIPPDRDNVFSSLDKISIAPDSRTLFIKIDYYRDTFDESTNTRTGIEGDGSVIWLMNAEDGIFERYIEVPFFEYAYMDQNRGAISRMLYSLMGVIEGGRIFLFVPVEGGYSILIMSSYSGLSGEQHRGFIRVDEEELLFNTFDLSDNGILSGLLVNEWQVRLVWWRTDRFIGEFFQ